MSKDPTIFDDSSTVADRPVRLWIYVIWGWHPTERGKIVFKMGQHVCETRIEAVIYAQNETLGKFRGTVSSDNVIYCEDHTEYAHSLNFSSETNYAKYDDEIRSYSELPHWGGKIVNDAGGGSHEIYVYDEEEKDNIIDEWIDGMKEFKERMDGNSSSYLVPDKKYKSRAYHDEGIEKIKGNNLDRFLLGACPGSGKEVTTLSIIQYEHDKNYGTRYDEKSLHVHIPTVPSTGMETIEELATVSSILIEATGEKTELNRFTVYCLESYYDKYLKGKGKNEQIKNYIRNEVNVVKSIEEIPEHDSQNEIPLLVGSYHHLGLNVKNDKIDARKKAYKGLSKRLGALSIGEAHQFLSNEDNKMWTNIQKLDYEFLLLVTGTPYDYIYNEEHYMYFYPEERVLYTRNDLMNDFPKDFPISNYYGINARKAIEVMKNHPDYSIEDGHTWKGLFSTVEENGEIKFKYPEALITLFRNTFDIPEIGLDSKPTGMSIHTAPELCDKAKQNVIVALPIGSDGIGVDEYIPMLKELIEDYVGNYKILEVYDDVSDSSSLKDQIKDDGQPTITLTCNKFLTGTNIPSWGSVFLFRKIGNSIKLLEQIFGRIQRAFDDKTNCGIFIGDLDAVIELQTVIEMSRNNDGKFSKSIKDVREEFLKNANFFTVGETEWEKIDEISFHEKMQELFVTGLDGVKGCIKSTPPDDFDLKIEINSGGETTVTITNNGNKGAKNKNKVTVAKQTALDLKDKKGDKEDIRKWWRNLQKIQINKMRYLCFIENFESFDECYSYVDKKIKNKDSDIINFFGKGYEFYEWMNDSSFIDKSNTELWCNLNDLPLDKLFEIFDSKYLRNEGQTTFVTTPTSLVKEIIGKLLENDILDNPRILDSAAGRGIFLVYFMKMAKDNNIEIDPKNVYFNDVDVMNYKFFKRVNKEYNLGIPEGNIFNEDFLNPSDKFKRELDMKFDVVVGNPPYQKQVGPNKTQAIWPEFVEKSFELCKEGGYVSLIHPGGWRDVSGIHEKIKDLILSKDLKSLNMNTLKDGLNVFGAHTRFDWYVVKNHSSGNSSVEINDMDKNVYQRNIGEMKFIPNGSFDKIKSLLAKDDEETVDIIYDRSAYGTDKDNMSKEKAEEFKYPVISVVRKNGDTEFIYSNTNENGHFGIPKVVWSNTNIISTGTHIDSEGKYGLTQFNYAIADEPENLENIAKALKSDEFIELMKNCIFGSFPSMNRKVISLFRKDFWKEFIDED